MCGGLWKQIYSSSCSTSSSSSTRTSTSSKSPGRVMATPFTIHKSFSEDKRNEFYFRFILRVDFSDEFAQGAILQLPLHRDIVTISK